MAEGSLTYWGACSRCGKRVRVNRATSRPDPVCHQCRREQFERLLIPRACVNCGDEFHPSEVTVRRLGEQKACSHACRMALFHRARAGIVARPLPCSECGVSVETSAAKVLCDDCRKAKERVRWQQKNRRRRAKLREVASEPYTLAEIAERDRFRCQLCRRRVDMAIPAPHPLSPSIDHLVPLSEGGDDTRANVQLAHRQCNTRKGARGMQQLTLVG